MAGTGLPIPKTGLIGGPSSVINADQYSVARSWGEVAQSGARIAAAGVAEAAAASQMAAIQSRAAEGQTRIAEGQTRIAAGESRIAEGATRLAATESRIAEGASRLAGAYGRAGATGVHAAVAEVSALQSVGNVIDNQTQKFIHQQQVGYLADAETDARRTRIELRDQFSNDPEGFDNAWNAYQASKLENAQPWAVPHMKRVLSGEGNTGYSAILGERRARDQRLDTAKIDTLIKQSDGDVIAHANANTLASPDGLIAVQKYQNQVDAAVASGLIPREQADFMVDDLRGRAQAEIAAREGVDVYREQGKAAAVDHLRKSIRENTALTLSPAAREKAFSRGLQAIRQEESLEKQDRAGVIEMSADLRKSYEANIPVDATTHRSVEQALLRTGAAAELHKLTVARAVHESTAPYRDGLKLREFAGVVAGQRVSAMPGTPQQTAAVSAVAGRLGISARDLSAAISYETGGSFDPNKWGGKGGNHLGLIQFGAEERAKYGVRPGMTFEQQMGAVENYLRDRGVKPGMGISEIYRTINGGNPNAPLSASDGNATIGEHIERIKRGHYGNADSFLGTPGGEVPQPHSAEIAKRVQDVFVKQSKAAWPAYKALIQSGKPLEDDDYKSIQYAALLSGDPNWQREVEALGISNQLGVELNKIPTLAGKQAFLDTATAELKKSGLPVIDQETITKSLNTQYDQQNKLVRESPVDYAIGRGQQPPREMDFSSPAAAQAGLMDRVHIARGVAADQQVPFGTPLRDADTAAVAGAISGPDPKRAAAAFSALSVIPDDMLTAALSNSVIKAAVSGAARSGDVMKYSAAMQFMDQMWSRSAETTTALFGKDAINDLMDWQANLRYSTPEQMAKAREKASQDPQVRKQQEKLVEDGEKVARKFSIDEVAKQFDTSWWLTPGPIARATGSQPLPPIDELTGTAMMGDYVTIYGQRYAGTLGNEEKAKEQTMAQMKTKWTSSPVNGGRLMLNAPETLRDSKGNPVYPAVGGTHDWMRPQIEAAVVGELYARRNPAIEGAFAGPPQPSIVPSFGGQSVMQDTAAAPPAVPTYTLVSDRQTQAEAQAGQAASYRVVVLNPDTGQLEVLPRRFAFDPRDAQAKDRWDGEQQRARQKAKDTAWDYMFPGGNDLLQGPQP